MQKETVSGEVLQNVLGKIENTQAYKAGNRAQFSPAILQFDPISPLAGKRIAFLGSSLSVSYLPTAISMANNTESKEICRVVTTESHCPLACYTCLQTA